jgi:hypothetical protein
MVAVLASVVAVVAVACVTPPPSGRGGSTHRRRPPSPVDPPRPGTGAHDDHAVPGGNTPPTIVAGRPHLLAAVGRHGALLGNNAFGQLGTGTTTSSPIGEDPGSRRGHDDQRRWQPHLRCRVGNTVRCWGNNADSQLGDGGNTSSTVR